MAVMLFLGPLSFLERLDSVLLNITNTLTPLTEHQNAVVILQYGADEVDSEAFKSAYESILASAAISISFLDQPPLPTGGKSKNQHRPTVHLFAVPHIPTAIWGVSDPREIRYRTGGATLIRGTAEAADAWLRPIINYPPIPLPVYNNGRAIDYPAYHPRQETLIHPLVWRYGEHDLPDLAVILAAEYLQSTPQTIIDNHRYGWIYSKPAPAPEIRALEEVSPKALKGRIVLIGERHRTEMTTVAQAVESLVNNQLLSIPPWAPWATIAALAALFIFVITLAPRLALGTLLLFNLLLFFIIVGGLVILAGFKSNWIPSALPIAFLISAFALSAHFNRRQRILERLTNDRNNALAALAQSHLEQRELDNAYDSAIASQPHSKSLDLLYDIGIEYEKRRQYQKALGCFNTLQNTRKRYKDVKDRIARLQSLTLPASNQDMSETLVINELARPQLGRYEIESEIGRGAMGIVYMGRDPKIQRRVAIKTLDYNQIESEHLDEWRNRFFREAEAAGRLSHPNIVTVYDVGDEGNLGYIAMDYVPGPTLSEFTHQEHLLPLETLLPLMVQVAQALDYAHRQGIVHRDIKPGNIILDRESDIVKVADFGVARISDTSQTRTGILVGSPSYMAPEQFTHSKVDGKADLFSLGVTIYQLLSGHLPFDSNNLAQIAYLITNEKHTPIRELRPDLPRTMSTFINKALQKNPENRYESGGDMANALTRIIEKSNLRYLNAL